MPLFSTLRSLRRHVRAISRLDDTANRMEQLFQLERERALREAVTNDARLADPRSLNRFEHQLFSQCGQDGILAEIFRRLGVAGGVFAEFGVGAGDGFETNSTALLLRGWRGFWFEGSPEASAILRQHFAKPLASGQLRLECAFLTRENIADLFAQAGVPEELDLLSIDVDGNDVWLWEALRNLRPKCVSIEYNSHFPAGLDWRMPYRANHVWAGTMEYGASATAIERAGAALGYQLVACDLAGCDAFLVRNDLCDDRFAGPFTAEQWQHPCRHYLIGRPGHARRLTAPFAERGE